MAKEPAAMRSWKQRTLFYLVLALISYAIAFASGESKFGFIVFFVAGALAELTFWLRVIRRIRGTR
jgi:hypothetical protein